MRKIILDSPKQFSVGLKAAENIKVKGIFENVIVSGMGGSAWPTDIFTNWLTPSVPIYVNRTYNLPPQANSKTLAIFSSYSGNTEEPLFSFKEAMQKKIPSIGITSGGELKKLCQKNNIPAAIIPSDFQPRMATGFLFPALSTVLSNCGIIKDKSKEILEMADNLKPENFEEQGKQIAKKFKGKIPIIYTPDRFRAIGYVWKIKFNENSKTLAFCNYFSELNHNEINGWENILGNFSAVILRDPDDHPRMLKQIEFTEELIKSKNVDVEVVEMEGKNSLSKIFNAIILGDWISYYLSLENKVDPIKLKIIEDLKAKLKSE